MIFSHPSRGNINTIIKSLKFLIHIFLLLILIILLQKKKTRSKNLSPDKRETDKSVISNFKTANASSVIPKVKSNKSCSKRFSQVEALSNGTYFCNHDDPIDPHLLRPISTSLELEYYLIFDSSATVTLVKHKEMLYNVRNSPRNSVQITSCSNTDIPCAQEGDLLIKTLNGKQIKIHTFYTLTIDHTILFTSDLRFNH